MSKITSIDSFEIILAGAFSLDLIEKLLDHSYKFFPLICVLDFDSGHPENFSQIIEIFNLISNLWKGPIF